MNQIIEQLKYFLEALGSPPVETVYFGGGTPNTVPLDLFAPFLEAFTVLIPGFRGEWTVEVNPEALTDEQVRFFASCGINRLSMGIQSFNGRLLGMLGRHVSPDGISSALELIASCWPGELNIDLITAIPGQTREDAFNDINRVLSYRPDHISLYSLTLEDGTPLEKRVRRGEIREYPHEDSERLWFDSIDLLSRAGYRQYEVSNFALPGREGKHNLRYWNMLPYAGCGPSAASTLSGTAGVLRIENPRNIMGYLKGKQSFWNASVSDISNKELCSEFLMMGLRLSDGLSVTRFGKIFGLEPVQLLPRTIEMWKDLGMLTFDGDHMLLTGSGRYLQDSFLIEALTELDYTETRLRDIEWP